jgi:hypothetical protein
MPSNLLESMSQVSSSYSLDKSTSTLPTKEIIDNLNVKLYYDANNINDKNNGINTTTSNNNNNNNNRRKMTILNKQNNNIDLEETEESDVLNEISKVNRWLKDNNENSVSQKQKNISEIKNSEANKSSSYILTNTYEEDDDNYQNEERHKTDNSNIKNNGNNIASHYSIENNDSAIEISSYG